MQHPVRPAREPDATKRMVAHPGSMANSMSKVLDENDYASFQRQDRAIMEHSRACMDRKPAPTSHWKSMHVATFTDKSPDPHLATSYRNAPVLPVVKSPSSMEDSSIRTYSDLRRGNESQKVLGAKGAPSMASPKKTAEDMSMTWPCPQSCDAKMTRPPSHIRTMRAGTTQDANHPPGYMGFIPSPNAGPRAVEHGKAIKARPTQRCKEDTLFDSFREKPSGYQGYEPTSVYNRRTWEIPEITTNGAANAAMQGMGYVPKPPDAGGSSELLNCMFSGPLDGRPSDNGVFNSQVFYKLVRPLEGACRAFNPISRHPAGRKFLNPSITIKNF